MIKSNNEQLICLTVGHLGDMTSFIFGPGLYVCVIRFLAQLDYFRNITQDECGIDERYRRPSSDHPAVACVHATLEQIPYFEAIHILQVTFVLHCRTWMWYDHFILTIHLYLDVLTIESVSFRVFRRTQYQRTCSTEFWRPSDGLSSRCFCMVFTLCLFCFVLVCFVLFCFVLFVCLDRFCEIVWLENCKPPPAWLTLAQNV